MNSSNQVQKYQELAKRMRLKYSLDRLLAALVLLLCSPVYILIAIIIKFDGLLHPAHRGPIFYTETRVSAGKEFEII
ncbi:MAG: lipopolysaccharide/colanic/teichoic acid biosynthesis glycosyltransferase, partial [Candidatus Omnitrophota bacterium]